MTLTRLSRERSSLVTVGKPQVFDAPAKLQGTLLDFWQRPIAGPDEENNVCESTKRPALRKSTSQQ
jgi:hypothetical protein